MSDTADAHADPDADTTPDEVAHEAFDGRPAYLSATLAVVAAVFATAAALPGGVPAAAAGTLGVLLVAIGSFRGRHAAITLGAVCGFAGAVLAGLADAVLPALAAGFLAVLAWDLGKYAVTLGGHVGRAARTRQAELAHAALAAGVAVLATAATYAVYLLAAGGRPVTALVLLLAGVVLLARALD